MLTNLDLTTKNLTNIDLNTEMVTLTNRNVDKKLTFCSHKSLKLNKSIDMKILSWVRNIFRKNSKKKGEKLQVLRVFPPFLFSFRSW